VLILFLLGGVLLGVVGRAHEKVNAAQRAVKAEGVEVAGLSNGPGLKRVLDVVPR
jgi:hypothetical protein